MVAVAIDRKRTTRKSKRCVPYRMTTTTAVAFMGVGQVMWGIIALLLLLLTPKAHGTSVSLDAVVDSYYSKEERNNSGNTNSGETAVHQADSLPILRTRSLRRRLPIFALGLGVLIVIKETFLSS